MTAIHPQFVVDHKNRKKSVIIPYATWKRMLEAMEDIENIRAYEKAKAEPGEFVPFEEAVRQIKSKSRR